MAVVEMKKITLLAMNQDKSRLMSKMQQLGCVQVTPRERREQAQQAERDMARLEELQKRIDRLDLSVKRLAPFDKHKRGMLDPRTVAGPDQVASILASRGEVMDVVDRVEAIERTRGDLRAQEARAKAQIEQLTPWEALSVPLDKLGSTKTSNLFLVTVPQKHFDALMKGVGSGAVQVEEVSRVSDAVYLLVAAHSTALADLEPLLKDSEAARVQFPEITGTAALALDQLRARLVRIDEVRGQLNQEIEKLADQLPLMRVLRDVEALERDQLSTAQHSEDTCYAFMLSGWAPGYKCNQIEKALKKVTPLCEIEFEDPADDEKPPTMLRNNKAVSPFETIVKMFDQPDPHGFDPTLVMMPFWVCFFGMMVSDAGYGVILGLAAAFLFHKLGRRSGIGKMAFIVILGGLSTVFWGILYGGWFGISVTPLLFAPMEEPLLMVVLCLGIGVVHLFTGMGVAAYINIKRGKPLDALYDQGSWMMLLIGLGLMMVNTQVGAAVAITGTLIVLLMAGRDKKNPLKRLVSGLGALYGISGYVSDILSYARLFGMGLATGVIGMVINTLASMMMGSPVGFVFAVVILIFGHCLNLAINTLGAYVHSCRLQFIEFFGKFYEGGGREFRPLQVNTRYVDIAEE